MRRILVTGGAGFIGSNFVRMAARRGYDITVLDKLTYAGNMENIRDLVDSGKIEFIHGDVCAENTVKKAMHGNEAVVHFAAETHVDRSITEAGTFVRTDVYGTFALLEAAKKENVERFVHISTDEVYGESGKRPCTEDSPLKPKSPYAASKAGADRLAYSYFETYGLPVVITRCVNNFGPWQHPEKAVPLFTVCALVNHPLPVYGSGRNKREWIHVEDHCSALLALLQKKGVEGETYNIGTGERLSTMQVARAVVVASDKSLDLIGLVADRPGHVLSHSVNSERLRKEVRWSPEHSFRQSIPTVVGWYADNPAWWRETILGTARPYFELRHPSLVKAVEKHV